MEGKLQRRLLLFATACVVLFVGQGCVVLSGVHPAAPSPENEEQVYVLTNKPPIIRGQVHKCKESDDAQWRCRRLFGFEEIEAASWIHSGKKPKGEGEIADRERPVYQERPSSVLLAYIAERGSDWSPPPRDQLLDLFIELLDDASVPDTPEYRRYLIDEALAKLGMSPLPGDWTRPSGDESGYDLDFSKELDDLRDDE